MKQGLARSFFYPGALFKEANEHQPDTSLLQEGGSYSTIVPSVKIHVFKEGRVKANSADTPILSRSHAPLFFLPAVAHKWSKASSTF